MQHWADDAIDEALHLAEHWFRNLPAFENRVNLGTVVGRKHPAILSEQDCVMNFARFLHEVGVPWDAIHHQVSDSRWLFESPHPAAAGGPSKRWCVDLALLKSEDFLAAHLPAKEPGFQFDAFLEFAYLSDFFTIPGVQRYGEPEKSRQKVSDDVQKIAIYLRSGVCRTGYVIVFEECNCRFPDTFVADAEGQYGCRVRFVRGY